MPTKKIFTIGPAGNFVAFQPSDTVNAQNLPTMVGATNITSGSPGTVPASSAGDQNKLLSAAGTWVDLNISTVTPVSLGGTGATDAKTARTNLGLNTTISLVAAEDLGQYDLIYFDKDHSGVRLASNAVSSVGNKQAIGFTISSAASGQQVEISFIGWFAPTVIQGTSTTALVPGERYYLGTSGGVTDLVTTVTGSTLQYVGTAVTSTQLVFLQEDGYLL